MLKRLFEMANIYTSIRNKYGLSRIAISKVLGFGVNQWRKYEDDGVEPKDSHGLLIRMVMDPKSFKKLLSDNARVLEDELGKRKFARLQARVREMLEDWEMSEEANYRAWVENLYK